MRLEKHRNVRGNAAEFAPVLIVLFLLTVFPLLNGLGIAIGYVNAAALSIHWASLAAGSTGMESATSTVLQDGASNMKGGLAQMVKLNIARQEVFALRTDIRSKDAIQYIGPDERAYPPLNESDYVYEYLVRTQFSQTPFINMSAVPFIKDIPGLGTNFTYYVSQLRATEHVDGLLNDPMLAETTFSGSPFGPAGWKNGWPPVQAPLVLSK
jgi:hypothetical protein